MRKGGQQLLIFRIMAAALLLFASVMTLRRGLLLWRSDRRLPKTLIAQNLSRASRYGLERAMLPLAATYVFIGAVALTTPGTENAHVTGLRSLFGAIGLWGTLLGMGLVFTIIYFNRPRSLVPPFMRSEIGVTTAWWRSRALGRKRS